MRMIWLAIGWVAVGAAFVGIWLPVVPTVPFLLVALWAFTRGSPQLRTWLLTHPAFGEMLKDWHDHGTIPRHAKVMSMLGMLISYVVLATTTDLPAWALGLVAALFIGVAAYVLSRPTTAPSAPPTTDRNRL